MSEFDDWLKRNNAARPSENHQGIAPLAKRIAEENHLEWRSIKGTGEAGLILEKDVLMVLAKQGKSS